MMTHTSTPRLEVRFDTFVRLAATVLLGVASFFLLRPYIGIVHDARLYAGYAMAGIDPNGVGQDILVLHDGQSGFSVYPRLFRALVSWIGPSRAAIVSASTGLLLWFAAFLHFARRIVGPSMMTKDVMAVGALALALPSYYGGTTVLRYAEPFATPRAFAEAASLIALALVMERRRVAAAIVLAAGVLMHPLMTLPAVVVVVWLSARDARMRRLLLAAGAACAIGLCVPPLVGASAVYPFSRFDSEWLRILDEKNSLVFLRHWKSIDFARIVLHLATVAVAWRVLPSASRALVGGVLLVALGGLLLSLAGADLAASVIVAQGQPWRGLWLLAVVSSLLLGVLVFHAFTANRTDDLSARDPRWIAAVYLLIAAWFAIRVGSGSAILAGLALAVAPVNRRSPRWNIPESGKVVVGGLASVLVIGLTLAECWIVASFVISAPVLDAALVWQTIVLSGLPALAVCLMALYAMRTGTERWSTRTLAVACAAAMALAMLTFDARLPFQRSVEQSLDRRLASPASAKRGAVVWAGADLEPWAIEGAPAWGSVLQGISVVFSRELAVRWRARWDLLAVAHLREPTATDRELDAWIPRVDLESLRILCRGGDAPASIMVPSQSIAGIPAAVRRLAVPQLIVPRRFGGRWARIDSMSRVDCTRIISSTPRSATDAR